MVSKAQVLLVSFEAPTLSTWATELIRSVTGSLEDVIDS